MEKQNLNNVLLKDLEFYNPSATYVNLLNNKNIVTVEQLLTANKEKSFLKGYSDKSICQLLGFISMIEYKYLDKSLLCDALMDSHIYVEIYTKDKYWFAGTIPTINAETKEKSIVVSLGLLFGCPSKKMIPVFDEFIERSNNEYFAKRHNFSKENLKVIDFIKYVAGFTRASFKHIVPYAKAYVESYEKQQQLVNGDAETIQILKDQLTYLLETRDNLDKQITDLQQKIGSLSNTENKGGIKK